MGALKSRGSSHTSGPVPGTVEIASEHEIDTSAAVPGTDMEIGIRGGNLGERLGEMGAIKSTGGLDKGPAVTAVRRRAG